MLRMNIHLTVVLVRCGCWLWCLYSPYFLFCFWCWSMLISKLTLVHSKCWQWCWWSTACCARFGQTEANCKCFLKVDLPLRKWISVGVCFSQNCGLLQQNHLFIWKCEGLLSILDHVPQLLSTCKGHGQPWTTTRKPASQKNQKYLSKIQSRHRRTSCSTYFWRPARHVMNS